MTEHVGAGVTVLKGHGTENDFVLLFDPHVQLPLAPEWVAALCDRRAGLGGDGVIRIATASSLQGAGVLDTLPAGVAPADWFMDYRNSDGSIAEMCGNGVRVFAHALTELDLVEAHHFTVGSRAGGRTVTVHSADHLDADVSVSMGPVRLDGSSQATVGGRDIAGQVVDVGNPHLVSAVDDVAAFDLTHAPTFDAQVFPHGVNVEIFEPTAEPDTVRMRVYERGSGETRSCGTGTVAVAATALHRDGQSTGTRTVLVPGGAVTVTISATGATLRGPSHLVLRGLLQ